MSILARLLQRAARRALAGDRPYFEGTVTSGDEAGEGRGHRSNMQKLVQRNHSWVWVCANLNANQVAATPIHVGKRMGPTQKTAWQSRRVDRLTMKHLRTGAGERVRKAVATVEDVEEITDFAHPLVQLLNKPNPRQTGREMLYSLQFSQELAGDGYGYMVGNGPPKSIWPLQPQYVRAVPSKDGLIARYEYGRDDTIEQTFPTETMIQYTSWNVLGPYNGYGPLLAVLPDVDLITSIVEFRRSVLDRACQPGLIVIGQFGNESSRKAYEAQLNAKHAGYRKAGRSMVWEGNPDKLKVQNWESGSSEKTMGYFMDEAALRDKVAAAFGVPRALLTSEDLNLAQVKMAGYLHQKYAVAPRVQRLEDTLNEVLVTRYGDESLFVWFDSPIERDEAELSQRMIGEYGGGIRTKNEAREPLMLPAVPDGDMFADERAQANQEALLTMQAELAPEPDKEEEEEDGDEQDAGANQAGESDKSVARLHNRDGSTSLRQPGGPSVSAPGTGVGRGDAETTGHASACPCCTHHPRTGRDRCKDGFQRDRELDKAERELEAVLRTWFNALAVAAAISDPTAPGSVMDRATSYLALPSVQDSFNKAVEPVVSRMFAAGYDDGGQMVVEAGHRPPTLGVFAVTNTEAVRFLNQYQVRLAQSVTRTLAERLTAAIQEGVANADSIPQLTKRVQGVMEDASKTSAERIARTEASRAYLRGREAAWTQSGVVVRKEWLLSADPCPACQAMAQKVNTREIGVPFLGRGEPLELADGSTYRNDYESVETPPLHPQCVLPDSQVSPGSVVAATRGWYSGDIVTIRTERGREATVTAQHQMLGRGGWVEAASLNKGDDLICKGRPRLVSSLAQPHMYDGPTRIDEVFESLRRAAAMPTMRVPVAAEHFHGDGRFLVGKIDVVAPNGLLRLNANAAEIEKFLSFVFTRTDVGQLRLSTKGVLDAMLLAMRLAADGIVSGCRETLPLVGGGARHAKHLSLAAVAWSDTGGFEPPFEGGPTHAGLSLGECLEAFSQCEVEVDEVVDVDVRHYAGHVYDLTTVSGAYVCDGIIAHNCRCSLGAVFSEEVTR